MVEPLCPAAPGRPESAAAEPLARAAATSRLARSPPPPSSAGSREAKSTGAPLPCRIRVEGHVATVAMVRWAPHGQLLASSSTDGTVRLWSRGGEFVHVFSDFGYVPVTCLAWKPDGSAIVAGLANGEVAYLDVARRVSSRIKLSEHAVSSAEWLLNGDVQLFGLADGTVRVYKHRVGKQLFILEGHASRVDTISPSFDGELIATAGDGAIRFWRTDNWQPVGIGSELTHAYSRVAFHPRTSMLAVLFDGNRSVELWDLKQSVVRQSSADRSPTFYSSAKVVLVGESNAGKSCLALRIAEDRYEEQGTTHGLRFWPLPWEFLVPSGSGSADEHRELVLWDMGGQAEYRLVHQLFMHDTTVALIVVDPTRGRTALLEAAEWVHRFDRQIVGRAPTKLLIGSKLDDDLHPAIVDKPAIDRFLTEYGIAAYVPVSAKTSRGRSELLARIAQNIDWDVLSKTARPILFQQAREIIARRRERGDVVTTKTELEEDLAKVASDDIDSRVVDAVVEQLALQGTIAETRLSDGKRALVLQIAEIERYAGAIIIAARNSPRGTPVIEERAFGSPSFRFPGIPDECRLSPQHEAIVLECVVQLLLDRGICLRHEGRLVFPALFRPTEGTTEETTPALGLLHYDFSGAVSNIYSELVAALTISERFGPVRLWEDRAEFGYRDSGVYGFRKVDRGYGFASLDIFFKGDPPVESAQLFTSFVEERLRDQGVDIIEQAAMTCRCGFQFSPETIRRRILENQEDIGCPNCDLRFPIRESTAILRERSAMVSRRLWAMRSQVSENRRLIIQRTKERMAEARHAAIEPRPITLLHLSDLHFRADSDPEAVLQPLVADLRDREGLSVRELDYLILSGDFAHRGKVEEFRHARTLISRIIERFSLTAERCILVPGNHDLDFDELVYTWEPSRRIQNHQPDQSSIVPQGSGYLVRDENAYPMRFRNFNEALYHPLLQSPYPLRPEDQAIPLLFEEHRIQFLLLNSCWEIDEFFQDRASIHDSALARGLMSADSQLESAIERGRISREESILRIAVVHHPLKGQESIPTDAYLERLVQSGFRVALHGHVHEERVELVGYKTGRGLLHVIGGGAVAARPDERPESTPALYNLLIVKPDLTNVRVYTRFRRRGGGAWSGMAVWPGEKPEERRTYFDVDLGVL